MSLYVEVRKEDRIVNGELVKVGDCCYLPNSLALHLEKNGLVAWPQEKAALAAGKAKSLKRKASAEKAEERAANEKKGKGKN